MAVDPGKALGMGQNRNKSCGDQIEERLFQAWRRHMMGRFDERIPCIRQRQQPSFPQTLRKVGGNMVVRSRNEVQRHAFFIQGLLQTLNGSPDPRTGVRI